jgi:plasmid stabilization system protein ParE
VRSFIASDDSLAELALAELADARSRYELAGRGQSFLADVDAVFEALQVMPRRFPVIRHAVHRALLRHYPFAVFFRIRSKAARVVVLAVLPQRGDPAKWPSR